MYKHMSPLIGFVCHLKNLFLGFEQVKMCVYRWDERSRCLDEHLPVCMVDIKVVVVLQMLVHCKSKMINDEF